MAAVIGHVLCWAIRAWGVWLAYTYIDTAILSWTLTANSGLNALVFWINVISAVLVGPALWMFGGQVRMKLRKMQRD